MFHVEHMHKHFILIILTVFLLAGCEKPNPHPEALDPIMADIESELKATDSTIKSTEKELEGFQLEEKKVQPQTGQNKYAQKRIYETTARLDKLKQMLQYWELRRESRLKEARRLYMIAYKAKQPWPDPNEFKEYSMQKKLRLAPLGWSVKRRMEEAGVGIPIKTPGAQSAGAAGSEDAPPSGH